MGYTPLTPRTPARKPLKRKPLLPKFNENIVDEDIVNDIDELAPEKEDVNPLDEAVDDMNSLALMYVTLTKLKTVTIQTIRKKPVLKTRRTTPTAERS
ncbi:hypothetical protein DPMN_131996 [Dreissena polymorpha]|uniref:Uncharacterized protein n=1 Tax=Dreissena polymorpha TaxID=45954 RepID=A0A9D4FV21_DREPO|nr:hypothetical protein DPMN_131996 [Dreissena polymorpha]